jgi:integrin alpha FG-GAP repeat containing protein 1
MSLENFYFKKSVSFKHPVKVYNVVPGDFTHDGTLDLLVMSESKTFNDVDMTLYPGSLDGLFGTHSLGLSNIILSERF